MKFSAPTKAAWWIAVIAGVLGIVGNFVAIPYVSAYAFWFVVAAFVILALATLFKGL